MNLTNILTSEENLLLNLNGKKAVHKWIPSDSEEAFLYRLKKDPKNPSLLHYLNNPITYKLNNYGFRTPVDFVNGIEGNVFLGCSHTFGIGNYLENTWSWKLNEYIGGNFLNLGTNGACIGRGFRLLYGLKGMIRPKNVFLFFPHPYRFEYYIANPPRWRTVSVHSKGTMPLILEKNNMEMYYYLHFNAIETLCKELDVPLYAVGPFDLNNPKHDVFPTCARDKHFSPSSNIIILEEFKRAYNNKIKPYSRPWNDYYLKVL